MMKYGQTTATRPIERATEDPPADEAADLPPVEEIESAPAPIAADMAEDSGAGEFVDAASSLVDELERILHDDFAEPEEEPVAFDHFADAGFPLAEPEPLDAAEPEPAESAYDAPESEAFYDDEPAPVAAAARFWHADEIETRTAPPLADERLPRSRLGLTIPAILLLIAAGGAYAYVQLSHDPVGILDEGMTVASAGALGPTIPAAEAFAAPAATAASDPVAEPAAPASEGIRIVGVDPVPLAAERTGTADPAPVDPPAAPATETPATDPAPAAGETAPNAVIVATVDPAGNPVADGEAAAPMGGPLVPVADDPPAADPAPPAAETPATAPAAGMTTATATTWVNMHTGPENATPTILVVPEGAELQVVACDPWCEVYYDGNHGYIWRDFVTPLP